MMVMVDLDAWDWEVDKRMIADLGQWKEQFEYIEEPYVSPDGEKIAAVVKPGEMEFSVCENGTVWENTFDKVWYLRYTPDGRLVGLVSDTGAWTVAVDGEAWEETYDFVWNTQFSEDGKNITVAAQIRHGIFCGDQRHCLGKQISFHDQPCDQP
jgi:oligoribonuclease NrnB/cAMP/cGMP phosphodiesterase (DHH superfamily)